MSALLDLVRDLAAAAGIDATDDDAIATWLAAELASRAELRAAVKAAEALVDELRTEHATALGVAEALRIELEQARAEIRRLARNNPSASD